MRMRLFSLVVCSVILFAARAQAQVVPPENMNGELGVMWWKPTPELTVQDVDFVGDLGIADKRFKEYRVMLKLGRAHKLRFGYVPVKYEEQGTVLLRAITFKGVTYNLNVPVNASLKWDLYRFGYEWDVISRSHAFVGAIAELKYNKVAGDLVSPTTREVTEVNAPIPTIGGIARIYVSEYISVTGEFTGLKLDRRKAATPTSRASGFSGTFYDLDVYGQLNLNRYLAIQGGYHSVKVDYFVDDDQGKLTLKGPYFGGVIRY